MDPSDLEREIHDLLSRGPAPLAPPTLRLRVMAAVRAHHARPWYQRSWFAWPLMGRLASVGAAAIVVAACVIAVPMVASLATAAAGDLARGVSGALRWAVPPTVREGFDWFVAARVVWRTVVGPATFYAAVFAVAVGGASALCVAALARLTLGRTA